MDDFSLIAGIVLAAVFVAAAATKLASQTETIEGFTALGLPIPDKLSWLVPLGEISIAILLLVARPWGAVIAFATLVGFTVFLAGLVRSGRPVACRCFGGASSEPVSSRTLVRNGVFIALALVALVGA